MVFFKNASKPNFKVKHPYGNMITSIFTGALLFFASVLTVGTSFFGLNDLFKTYAYSGSGTSANPFVIYAASDFSSSEIQTALKTAGKYVALGDDISLGATYVLNDNFYATFDGRGYTISSYAPFVNNNYGVIKNTTFAYSSDEYNYAAKVVNSSNYGTIQNVFVESDYEVVSVNKSVFGGVAAKNYGEIKQVVVEATIENAYDNALATGGVVGQNFATINQVANKGNVTVAGIRNSETKTEYATAGGVAGTNGYASGYVNEIFDVYNEGQIVAGNGAQTSAGAGVRGGHAGGIVGVNTITSGAKATIENAINYGVVIGGTGGTGANGAGGAGATTTTGGSAGAGGYGGGAGGNASGIVGYAASASYIEIESSLNFGSVIAGFGGNGGAGGGGGGGSQLISYSSSYYVQVSVTAKSGYGVGVGGDGAIIWSYYASAGSSLGSGGAGGGGGAGAGATAKTLYSTALAQNGGNGGVGGAGTVNVGGTAGSAGRHYGLSSGASAKGNAGETNAQITGHFGNYYILSANGGNGGVGGIGGLAKETIYATEPSTSKTDYAGFDFVSDSGWSMGETKPTLRFEEGETYVNVTVNVYYNGADVTANSSDYISVVNTNNAISTTFADGAWVNYTNPVLGGSDSINTSVNSEYEIENAGNYIYMVKGIEEVLSLTAPSSFGATTQQDFVVNDSVFRSNEDNVIEVNVYVYDQLQGTGTSTNPYRIEDFHQFANMDVYDASGVYFELQNDIVVASGYDNTFVVREFEGVLNGNGHTITRNNLYNRSLIEQNAGTIKDLTINLATQELVFEEPVFGLLVSDNVSGDILNVSVDSSLPLVNIVGAGDTNYTFGVVAGWNAGNIQNVVNNVNLQVSMTANQTYTSLRYVGGFVGLNKQGGSVLYARNLGNLEGQLIQGSQTTTVYMAGVAGKNAGTISYSYTTKSLVANNASSLLRYNLSGIANNEGVVDNTFVAVATQGGTTNETLAAGATNSYVVTTSTNASQVSGWNIATDWALNSYVNNGLPALRWQTGGEIATSATGLNLTATEFVADSASSFASVLAKIETFAGNGTQQKTILLGADIDMQGYALPVVNIPSNVTIDAQGYALKNATNNDALFATNYGTIANLVVDETVLINGVGSVVSGLVKENQGTIENVVVASTIVVNETSQATVGGLAGVNTGSLQKSFASVHMMIANASNLTIGGVAGLANAGSVAYNRVDGVFDFDNVTSSQIGYLAGTSSSVVTQNLVVASTNNASVVSGAVASVSGASLSANYIAQGIYGGTLKTGVVAKTTTQLKQTSTYTNWNFDTTWYQASATYPVLWETLTNISFVTITMNTASANAYVVAYNSNGSYVKTISSTTSIWVKNADRVAGSGTLATVSGNVEFLVQDQTNDYLSVVKTVNGTDTVLANIEDYDIVASDIATTTTSYVVQTQVAVYGFELQQPVVAGNTEIDLGVWSMQIVRGTQTINVSVTYHNGVFAYDMLQAGDVVTLVYKDSATSQTFASVQTTNGYYATELTKNDVATSFERSTTALTMQFVVGENTATKEGTDTTYGVSFAELQKVELQSSLENMQPASGEVEMQFVIPSVGTQSYLTAYVLQGLQVTLQAPAVADVDGNDYDFVNFSANVTLQNASNNETASFVVGNEDVAVVANYEANFYTVSFTVAEEGQTGDLEHSFVVVNDGAFSTTASQTMNVSVGSELHIIVIGSQPTSRYAQLNALGYYTVDKRTSVLPDSAMLNGLRTEVTGDTYFSSGIYTYNDLVATEIVLTVNQNYVNEDALYIDLQPATITTGYNNVLMGSGTQADPYMIENIYDLALLSDAYYNYDASSAYVGDKYFAVSGYIDALEQGGFVDGDDYLLRPIGTEEHPFEGHFDGNNVAIRNLKIEGNGTPTGLFGVVAQDAVIEHVRLYALNVNSRGTGSYVAGETYYDVFVGGLAGINYGTILNSYISNNMTSANTTYTAESNVVAYSDFVTYNAYVGGLVGLNAGNLYGSYNQANVTSGFVGGGLVGLNLEGLIVGSYNLGVVSAMRASGLVGRLGTETQSNANVISYSYNAASVTAFAGGVAYGITENYIENAGAQTVVLNQVYSLTTANGAYGNANATGITGVASDLVISTAELSDADVMYHLVYDNVEHVNFAYLTDGTLEEVYQENLGYPMITSLADTHTISVVVYMNDDLILDMDDLDFDNNGTRDWSLFAKIGTSVQPQDINMMLEANLFDEDSVTYLKRVDISYNGGDYVATNQTNSYSFETGDLWADVTAVFVFSVRTISVQYGPEEVFNLDNSLVFEYVPLYVNDFTISFETLATNATITSIQQYVDGVYVDVSNNLTSAYSGTGNYTARVFEDGLISKGSIYFEYTNLDDVLQFRVVAKMDVAITINNASVDTESNDMVITQVLDGTQTVVQTLSADGVYAVALPFGEFVNDVFELYVYYIDFVRSAGANTVETFKVYDSVIFANEYGQTGYETDLQTYVLNLTGGMTDFAGTLLDDVENELLMQVDYIETNKYMTVAVNTDYATHMPTLAVASTNVLSGESEIAISSQNDYEAVFDMEYNQVPTLSVAGVATVAGQTGVFRVGDYNYRAIWVVGDNNLLTELSKTTPDYAFGLSQSYEVPFAILDQTTITLYVVELFGVGTTATLHSSSFDTSYDTSEAHAPVSELTTITASNVITGKTLPGSFADVNNAEYVDFGASASFASSKEHLTDDVDYNRYEFYNWDDNSGQTMESAYMVESITSNVNATAYYKIVTVLVYIGSNENVTAYDETLNIVGYELTEGNQVYEYLNAEDIDITTIRTQYLNASGNVMMEAYLNGNGYKLDNHMYGFAKYRVGYGETVRATRIYDDAFTYDAASINYYSVTDYTNLTDYNTTEIVPVAVAPETSAIYKTANNYYEGATATVYGNAFVFMKYYAHYNVSLQASVTTYSTGASEVLSDYFTDDRGQLFGIAPNGDSVSYEVFTTELLNEETQVTMRYNASENAGGFDLDEFEFVGWQVTKHTLVGGIISQPTYSVYNDSYIDGVSYDTAVIVENGNTYYTVSFTLHNTALEYLTVSHTMTIRFAEKYKVVTISENLEGYGYLSATQENASTSLLGLNGLDSNQFRAYMFGSYVIGVTPRSDMGASFSEGWLTIDENDFVYSSEVDPFTGVDYYIYLTTMLNGDLSNASPVVQITYTV